jgi:hypothetical protein
MASGRVRLHRQAAERGQDLHTAALAIAMGVLLELGVAGPVPGVLNIPAFCYMPQWRFGCGPETDDVATGLIDRLAIALAFAAHHQDRGAAWPVLHHPRRCRHPPQGPGEVAAALAFAVAPLKHRLTAVGQPIADDTKALSAVFHRDQEVGATLLDVGEKGRFACSASPAPAGPQARHDRGARAEP